MIWVLMPWIESILPGLVVPIPNSPALVMRIFSLISADVLFASVSVMVPNVRDPCVLDAYQFLVSAAADESVSRSWGFVLVEMESGANGVLVPIPNDPFDA